MKIGDKITDGSATFIVRSTGGVQSVNNVRSDDTGNINITNIDNANHANTASSVAWSGVTGKPSSIIKVASWDGSTLSLTTAT